MVADLLRSNPAGGNTEAGAQHRSFWKCCCWPEEGRQRSWRNSFRSSRPGFCEWIESGSNGSQPLSAFGLDSMMATELKNRMELSLQVPVSVIDLLKGVCIADFAASLLTRIFG